MAKFLEGNELNLELERLFKSAESQIILISPYIKLHDRYKSSLLTKFDNPNLEIIVLFGKNEDDPSKSMKQDDLDFFKQFPNIQILYEKRLHAKYYANESKALLTSMNLYGYSQNNNIEVGVLIESSSKISFSGQNELDANSWEYFRRVLDQAEVLYDKRPVFEKKNILSGWKYVGSEVEEDRVSDFFGIKSYKKVFKKEKPARKERLHESMGYCIRTGKEIPFNIEKPLDYEAYKMWSKYNDPDYPEKYCHFSGENSDGNTSVNRPILNRNWKKAKQKYNL